MQWYARSQNAYRDAYVGLPREIWILSLALFINRCGAMVLAFLTLYLTNELGFTIRDAGLISAFGAWDRWPVPGSAANASSELGPFDSKSLAWPSLFRVSLPYLCLRHGMALR